MDRIVDHLAANDFVPIDLTGANETQIYQILEFIETLSLSQQGGIVLVGW
jgi:hypothetical protein